MDIYNLPHIYELAFTVFPPLCIWRKKWAKEVCRFLRSLPLAPSSVADLCCGAGFLSPFIKKLYPEAKLVGIDRNRYMIKFARKHFPFSEFSCMDLSDVNGEIDLFPTGGGLTTIPLSDAIDAIMRIKPRYFILSGYRISFWSFAHMLFTKILMEDRCQIHSPEEVKKMFISKGLKIEIRMMDIIEGTYIIYKNE